MTETPADAVATLDALRASQRERALMEAHELELAAHFGDVYTVGEGSAIPGTPCWTSIGGDGTPEVSDMAGLELGAALGMRPEAAMAWLADALDLRHRLPKTWALVMDGTVPAWRARWIASATRRLDAHAAGLVDLQLDRYLPGMAWSRVQAMVEGLVLEHLPVDAAKELRQTALDARHVTIAQSEGGVADVSSVVDATDGERLESTVTELARVLAAGGVTGGRDARRAKALGLLASPARALQLLQANLLDELPVVDGDAPCPIAGQPGHTCGQVTVDPELLLPKASVVVHLTDQTLADGVGPARIDRLRPVLAEWLRDLIGDARITVRPVIDTNHQTPSDCYEAPPTMREAVGYRNPFEVFPWSTRRSAGLDLDHTIPWAAPGSDDGASTGSAAAAKMRTPAELGGTRSGLNPRPPAELVEAPPPDVGLTHPDNLGPLTRRAHRGKTHAGWRLAQPLPGHFLWQSPLGYRYLVTPSRTLDLGRPDAPASVGHSGEALDLRAA